MVDRLDALTRFNRAHGVGQVMITHSLADLDAVADPADRAKASGFVERAGMLLLGGLPHAELTGCAGWCDLTDGRGPLGHQLVVARRRWPPPYHPPGVGSLPAQGRWAARGPLSCA